MKEILSLLQSRSLVEQQSAHLEEIAHKKIKVYLGFDPTAESLHLGHLVGIVVLKHFQNLGHEPYILLGGATGLIGDPSGKVAERPLLQEEAVVKNVSLLRSFFESIFDRPVILNNYDWFSTFSFLSFLRDVGKQFRLGPMLGKESVKTRLAGEGMSFTEFSYRVLQAYDFYHLHQNEGVVLQIGGSDQWGNITAGIEYIRKRTQQEAFGLTFPLLTRSDGKKFGKTESGAVWLSSHLLSPYAFYQYFFTLSDVDAVKLLKMLTFLPIEELHALEGKEVEPHTFQKLLATEVTRFVHGEEGLSSALKVTENVTGEISLHSLKEMEEGVPCVEKRPEEVIGKKFVELAAEVSIIASKSEGVRLIKNGGAYLNNQKLEDPAKSILPSDLIEETYLLLGLGKKKKVLIRCIKNTSSID